MWQSKWQSVGNLSQFGASILIMNTFATLGVSHFCKKNNRVKLFFGNAFDITLQNTEFLNNDANASKEIL